MKAPPLQPLLGMAAAVLLALTTVRAQVQPPFYDGFDRANVSPTTNGPDIGAGYLIATPSLAGNSMTSSWAISADTLQAIPGANVDNVLATSYFQTAGGVGNGWTVSASATPGSTGHFGLALDYRDPNDFYAIRLQPSSSSIELHYVSEIQNAFLNDQFMRANVGPTTNGSLIGPGYFISAPAVGGQTGCGQWSISSDTLTVSLAGYIDDTIVNQSQALLAGSINGSNFNSTVSANLSSTAAGFMGLVLNWQDQNDFYVIRLNPTSSNIQLIALQTVSGTVNTKLLSSQTLFDPSTVTTPANLIVGQSYVIRSVGTTDFTGFGASTVPAGSFSVGRRYIIKSAGSTNFTTIGATSNAVGTFFVATGVGSGTGIAYPDTAFSATAVGSGTGTLATPIVVQTSRVYTLKAYCAKAGAFSYTLIDTTNLKTASGSLSDPTATGVLFSGGYGGVYVTSAAAIFSSISLSTAAVTEGTATTGSLTKLSGGTMSITSGDTYNLTVTSNAAGNFSYIVTDLTSPATAVGTLADAAARFRQGYVGFYADGATATFQSIIGTSAGNFADNFNRADTGSPTTDGGIIGLGYSIATSNLSGNSGTSGWAVSTDVLSPSPGSNSGNTIINHSAQTFCGSGAGFAVSGSFNWSASGGAAGLVVNSQDGNDYYAIKLAPGSSTIQLVAVKEVSGVASATVVATSTLTTPQSTAMTIATGDSYTVSVTSTTAGTFVYTVTDGHASATGTLTDSAGTFNGGFSGFYVDASTSVACDNLVISPSGLQFLDNFERADTGLTTLGAVIAPGYVISTPALPSNTTEASWQISSGQLTVTPTTSSTSDTLIYANPALTTGSYSVSGLLTPTGPCFLGLTLNYQDANDFYAIRIEGGTSILQLICVRNTGSSVALSLVQGATLPFTIPGGTATAMTVSSSAPGVFNYTITTGSNTSSGTLTDSAARFSGGFAGYYAGDAQPATFGPISIESVRATTATQYLSGDPHFQQGVSALNVYAAPRITAGSLQLPGTVGAPIWTLGENFNVVSLYPSTGTLQSDGSYLWQVPYTAPSGDYYALDKSMNIAPTGSAAASNFDLMIEVNSIADFDGIFRVAAQRWPAAYFTEHMGPAGGTLNASNPTLADLKSLQLSLTAAIPYQYNNTGTDRKGNPYQSNLHLSHLELVLIVQNLNPVSVGYGGQYIELVFQLYNSQSNLTQWTTPSIDPENPGILIVSPGLANLAPAGVGSGGSTSAVTISGDILPLIKQCLEVAWAEGALRASQNMADYQIGAYQIGWEVPGLATVQASLKDQSLIGTW